MPTLVKKSRVLLNYSNTTHNTAIFVAAHDDTQQIYRTVQLTVQDWEELGNPETITMTIEPGNKLGWAIQSSSTVE
jgi:hypothetical protein